MSIPIIKIAMKKVLCVMNKDDRRRHKRYTMQDGIFAAIPSKFLVGQVKNISKGGVSFTYIATEKIIDSRPSLEVFSKDKGFYLREIPFKIVSEIDVEDYMPFSSLPMKRIAGEFVELTEHQKSQLDLFIQNFAAAEA